MMLDNLLRKKKEIPVDENVLWKTPFYGVKGSISKVVLDDDRYLVTRYDVNGNDGEVLPTPKRRKKELYGNYIHDVKGYLEANHMRYLSSLSNQLKAKILKKDILIKVLVCSLFVLLSGLGIAFTTGSLLYFSILSFVVSFVASCYKFNDLKKVMDEEKRQDFIHEYKSYVNELNEYNMDREKIYSNRTQYSNIVNDRDKVIDYNRKLVKQVKR